MLTSANKTRLNAAAPFDGFTGSQTGLGDLLNKTKNTARLRYDFAVNAGAVGSMNLLDENGDLFTLPSGAIITQVYIDIITACVSTSNDGTIALKANVANDLLSAVDADTLSGITAGVPVGTAATMVKCTAARNIVLSIAVHALTAGKFDVYIDYVLGGV
jgi:hypothetical protein